MCRAKHIFATKYGKFYYKEMIDSTGTLIYQQVKSNTKYTIAIFQWLAL